MHVEAGQADESVALHVGLGHPVLRRGAERVLAMSLLVLAVPARALWRCSAAASMQLMIANETRYRHQKKQEEHKRKREEIELRKTHDLAHQARL